jgi:hypothetical protein
VRAGKPTKQVRPATLTSRGVSTAIERALEAQ